MPPALLERLPPIWQDPWAPSASGNSRLTSAAACWTLCKDAAGLDRDRIVQGVKGADPVQPAERQDRQAAGGVGDPGADQAGVAPLGHDRDTLGVAELEQGCDLGGRGRPQQQR